jgi:Zn finger protein HypA/HybF involved in hydrogenase expression
VSDVRPRRMMEGQRPAEGARPSGRIDEMEAYCLKCRTKREMKEEKPITMKNGKPATEGKCPVCGTRMFKIGKAA